MFKHQTLLPGILVSWFNQNMDVLMLVLCLLVFADAILSIAYHRRIHNVLVRPHLENPYPKPDTNSASAPEAAQPES